MKNLSLNPIFYRDLMERALREDLGRAGDLTTDALIPAHALAEGVIIARQGGCIAGLEPALTVFDMVGSGVVREKTADDGEMVEKGRVLARLRGPARIMLTGERTALNLLGRLSGIATETRRLVDAVSEYRARITCTRKTTPGLRALEKYAVRAGGGVNHRFGLDDAILIKDNHIAISGGIAEAVMRAKAHVGHMVKIEVEVDTLEQLDTLLAVGADAVLLDNMGLDDLRKAVAMVGGRMITEASGGIGPDTVREVAAAGVDYISAGYITHSISNFDASLDLEPSA